MDRKTAFKKGKQIIKRFAVSEVHLMQQGQPWVPHGAGLEAAAGTSAAI